MGDHSRKAVEKAIRWILSIVLVLCLVAPATLSGPVTSAKKSIKINYKKRQVARTESFTLKVTGLSSGQKVTWKLAGDGVVKKVSSTRKSIRLTAVKTGKTKVKAKVGKKTLSCVVTVRVNTEEFRDFSDFAGALSDLLKDNPVQSSAAIAANDPYYTGRLVVKARTDDPDFSGYDPSAILKSDDGIFVLQFKTSEEAKKALQQISNRSDVEWVESDQYIGTSDNDGETSAQGTNSPLSWGVSRLGADAYAQKTGSGEITVAVVDTGVSSHSFLSGRIVSGYDYIDNDNDPSDLNSHGTHVSGTIVDCTPGLNVKIMPIRVLDANGSGYTTTIATGIRYAVDHGAKVINLSLGGGHSSYMDTYIQYAVDHGVTVVAAAGNNYSNTSSFCPAHLSNILVVAAIDESETRAYFSNYGNSVDVAAPGVDIVSCVPGGNYASYDGTSMAAPHVSAIAAMVILNNPGITPAGVEQKIKNCSRDLGTSGWDMYYGYGIPDLSRMDDSQPVPTAAPTTAPTTKPTSAPTKAPTAAPTNQPTAGPSYPTAAPTTAPTKAPTMAPTTAPTRAPVYPTATPVQYPVYPTSMPVVTPTPGNPSIDGEYEYQVQTDLTALITGYKGYGGDLAIPTILGGYPVRGICDGAFRGNTRVTSLRIDGILGIGAHAFDGCTSLRSIDVFGMVEGVGSQAFANCTNLREIAIWGMMYQVSQDIFSGCTSLASAYVYGMIDQSVMTALKRCSSSMNINITGMIT